MLTRLFPYSLSVDWTVSLLCVFSELFVSLARRRQRFLRLVWCDVSTARHRGRSGVTKPAASGREVPDHFLSLSPPTRLSFRLGCVEGSFSSISTLGLSVPLERCGCDSQRGTRRWRPQERRVDRCPRPVCRLSRSAPGPRRRLLTDLLRSYCQH